MKKHEVEEIISKAEEVSIANEDDIFESEVNNDLVSDQETAVRVVKPPFWTKGKIAAVAIGGALAAGCLGAFLYKVMSESKKSPLDDIADDVVESAASDI